MGQGLEKRNVSIPLLGTLDTKTDEKLVGPGNFIQLSNAVREKAGTIFKRKGFSPLSTSILPSGSITASNKLTVFKDELILFDQDKMYSYFEDQDKWVEKGRVSPCSSDMEIISSSNVDHDECDWDELGNIRVVCWREFDNVASEFHVWGAAIDTNTGTKILPRTKISSDEINSSIPPKVCINGSRIYFIWIDSSLIDIFYREYRPATNDLGTITTWITSFDATAGWDVVGFPTGIAVTYSSSSGTMEGEIYNTSFVLVGGQTVSETTTQDVSIVKNTANNRFCISYVLTSPNRVHFFEIDNLGASLTGNTIIENLDVEFGAGVAAGFICTAVYGDGDDLIFFFHFGQALSGIFRNAIATNTYDTTTTVFIGSRILARAAFIASKPFFINNIAYIAGVNQSDAGNVNPAYHFIISNEILNASRAGIIIARFTRFLPSTTNNLPKIIQSSNVVSFISIVLTEAIIALPTPTTAVAQNDLNFNGQDLYSNIEIGDSLLIGGSVVKGYDGKSVTELGFFQAPFIDNLFITDVASGNIPAGTYFWKTVFEWKDNKGQIHRSLPSDQKSATLVSDSNVFVSPYGFSLSDKLLSKGVTAIKIRIYRTKISGDVFFFTKEIDNDELVNIVSIKDDQTDAQIAVNEQLYTTSGEVENLAPAPARSLAPVGNRVMATGLEDKSLFWFSKKFIIGEGVQFSDAFTRRADLSSQLLSKDDIVAGAGMDEKYIIFKRSSIVYQAGDGPLNTGLQDNFTQPQLISSDVGLTDLHSIVLTPDGLMFKSLKGIYILRRNLSVDYIGQQVEAHNSETITSAVLLADKNEVRFTTSAGVLMVYNYFFEQWSTFANYTATGATLWKKVYTHSKSNGVVNQEDTDHLDDAAAIPLIIEVGWLKLDGIQNFQRVYRAILLGEWKSDHTIKLEVFYDYQEFVQDTYILTPFLPGTYPVVAKPSTANLYAQVNDGVYQFEVHLSKQKCQAIKFRITDQPVATFGESFQLTDLTVQVGLKRGTNKIQANKRMIAQ